MHSPTVILIYMEEPDGCETKQGGKKIVYQLNKSFHGLKQSSWLWGETLEKVLVKLVGIGLC